MNDSEHRFSSIHAYRVVCPFDCVETVGDSCLVDMYTVRRKTASQARIQPGAQPARRAASQACSQPGVPVYCIFRVAEFRWQLHTFTVWIVNRGLDFPAGEVATRDSRGAASRPGHGGSIVRQLLNKLNVQTTKITKIQREHIWYLELRGIWWTISRRFWQ